MSISFRCPDCGKPYTLDDSLAGRKARCKNCQLIMIVPGPVDSRGESAPRRPQWAPSSPRPQPRRAEGPADDSPYEDREVPTPRRGGRSADVAEGGLSVGAILVIVVAGVAVVGSMITIAVMSRGPGTVAEGRPAAEAEGDARDLLGNPAGGDSGLEASRYPQLGALMEPLLTPAPVRDTSAHESHNRTIIQLIGRFNDALATVRDAASLRAAAEQAQRLGEQMKAETDRFHPPYRLTPTEDALMTQRLAPEARRELERCRDESRRIAMIPGLGMAGTKLLSLVSRHFTPLEIRLRMIENFKARTGPVPYAEVYVTTADEGAEAVCRQQLQSLLDGSSGMQWSHSTDWKKASFRIWPVDDPRQFADRIAFGKVLAVKGRNIFVTANAFTEAEVASARDANKKREIGPMLAAAAAGVPAPAEANDPKPPADADELTKILFGLRSSNPIKRGEAAKQLARTASNPDRNEEVTRQLIALLQDRDVFLVKDVMLAMVRWQTDETVPALIKQLESGEFFVRDEAAKILADLGDVRAVEPMIRILNVNPFVVDALRKMGAAAEPALINALTYPDPAIRRGVCDVLEQTGGKDALLAMMQLPADSDPLVRLKASVAMQAMQRRVGPVSVPRKGTAKPGRNPR